MKQIVRIKTANFDYKMEGLWTSFIFSYFFLFLVRNNLHRGETRSILIRKELLSDLRENFTTALRDLLNASYVEPSINELQKHPTRFQVLFLEDRKYKVNYRMSETGRMAYAIYSLIKSIDETILEETEVQIESK